MTDLTKKEKKSRFLPILIIGVFALFLVLPVIAKMIPKQNPDAGLEEKRALAEFPSLSEGDEFFTDLNTWFDDHIPFRLRLISAKKKITQKIEQVYRKKVHPFLSKLSTPDWYDSPEYSDRKTWDDPYLAPLEDNYAVYGRGDWLFYSGELCTPYFTGTNLLSEETEQDWLKKLSALQEYCEERGIRFLVAVAPNKEQVYPEYVPNYYIETADKRENRVERFLQENGISFRYLLNDLIEAKPLYECYMRQDTHWNNAGAYAAFHAIMGEFGIEVPKLQDIEVITTTMIGGDLSNFCGYSTRYPAYSIPYRKDVAILSDEKQTFSGNGAVEVIETASENPAHFVMVGDSFRDVILKFFIPEFSRVTSIHRDAIKEDAALQEIASLKEGDVLLLLAVERYDVGNPYAADCIIQGLK